VIILGIVAAVVTYALAFDYTEVDLEAASSETRQASLTRIVRALARPELVTYDTTEVVRDLDVAAPCGPATPVTSSEGISIAPSCASPGETMTVSGEGFAPGEVVTVNWIPNADVEIYLPMVRTQADDSGDFAIDFEVPDRPSDDVQRLEVVTAERVGTWGNRVEVWTDTNENGVLDEPEMGPEGAMVASVDGSSPDVAAVALVDPARSVASFVSFGDAFTATTGLANGSTATPVGEAEPRAGEPAVTAVSPAGGGTEIVVEAPEGTDLSGWRTALYDVTTGDFIGATTLTDQIELSPRVSETTWISLDAIIETVFLALVATTAGLLLAVPLSFIAARNIMRDISTTMTNLGLSLIGIPIGAVAGVAITGWIGSSAAFVTTGPVIGAVALVGILVAAWAVLRFTVPDVEVDGPSRGAKALQALGFAVAALLGLAAFLVAADLLDRFGIAVAPYLGPLDFIAEFFSTIAEILTGLSTIVAAIAGAGVAAGLASRIGYSVRRSAPAGLRTPLDVVLAAVAGSVVALVVELGLEWLYRFDDPGRSRLVAVGVGAVLGLIVGIRSTRHGGDVKIGLTIYYIARTIFNTLRAIEPLVMAIVFVVWVGIGPFAGSLALTLHTTAALAKLYSEQVEGIAAGPIEAVRATGATRLQTIVYAVVPQIVPPYISFTMYRWDINVRMSTILGFVGGGGIGFILQQNVNLLQYRSAAVQMLFIAIVVASMDYLSSRLRERML
jgi:phosphonate ABC transporter permease subunit PhnE